MTTVVVGGRMNGQLAPYPDDLAELVKSCTYRPNWSVKLTRPHYERGQGSSGLTLIITADTVNSHDHDQATRIGHLFPVPPAAYDRRSWQRWLFECFHQVELHECMEFFTIDGVKPYAPDHKPGRDPYSVVERGTWEDADTSFRGERNYGANASGTDTAMEAKSTDVRTSFRGELNSQ